jgi:dynactin-5
VIVREEVVLRPTYTKTKGKLKYVTLTIGDHVYIDRGSIVCAIKIGSNVHIGKNCVIGHRAILKDNCKILDNSVLPPDTVVPPFTVYGGRPAVYMGELPETIGMMHKDLAINFFKNF